MKSSSSIVRGVIGTSIGLILVWILIAQLETQDFSKIFENFSLPWIITAFCFYSLSTLLRAYRWKEMLLFKNVKLLSFFYVTSIHNLLNQLLPARTGEISYVVLLKKFQSVPSSQGVATLLLARVIDLLAMGVFFLIAVVVFWHQVTVPGTELFIVTFIALFLLLIVFMGLFSRRGIQVLNSLFSKAGLLKWTFFQKGTDFLTRLAQDLYHIKKSKKLLTYALLTLIVWGTKFIAFFAIIQNLVLTEKVTLWETVLGTTFSELVSVLPIYGFAGLGTVEGGWTLGFMLLGFEKEKIILSAFCFHFFLLSFASILGVASFFLLKSEKKSVP